MIGHQQNVHKHLKKTFVDARLQKLAEGQGLDWATAEALAFGTLLQQGYQRMRTQFVI